MNFFLAGLCSKFVNFGYEKMGVNKADVLVSWNFKHIVNLERIRGYNSINFRKGYQMTEIRTPKEIFDYEN
jgi:hypothetical protein